MTRNYSTVVLLTIALVALVIAVASASRPGPISTASQRDVPPVERPGFGPNAEDYGPGAGRGMGPMMGGGPMIGGSGDSFDEDRPFDLQFIDQMIPHHQMAIVSSEHMISDSERSELRELARNIQKSQAEQIDLMRGWREDWYGSPGPAYPDPDTWDNGMMGGDSARDRMRDAMGGDATDAMFLRMMIPHHQQAIDMSREALKRAEHPELKQLAEDIIAEQSAEIELMRGYLEEIQS